MNYKKKLKIKQLFYKMLGCLRRNLSTKCVNKNQEIQEYQAEEVETPNPPTMVINMRT